MRSIYIWQLVWPIAASLVMRMPVYIRGVASVRNCPYPAVIRIITQEILEMLALENEI